MKQYDDLAKLLLRLSTLLMLFHGVHKMLRGIGHIEGLLAKHGFPAWIALGVYIGEVIAPVLIAAGYYARVTSLILAFNMLAAISLTGGFFPLSLTKTGGPTIELALFYLIISLCIFLMGPGKYGINRK